MRLAVGCGGRVLIPRPPRLLGIRVGVPARLVVRVGSVRLHGSNSIQLPGTARAAPDVFGPVPRTQLAYQSNMSIKGVCPVANAVRRPDTMPAMRVYLGADHAGFELKNHVKAHLQQAGHDVVDCGALEYDALDDYPAYCIEAARRTVADPGSLGLVFGGSGNGEQIAANKVPGARCALAWSVETAQLARQHNNAQLIGIGGRMHSTEEALAIVDAFLATPWSNEERHQRRLDILAEYEKTGVTPPVPAY